MNTTILLAVCLLLMLLLAGCSGSGVSVNDLTGADLRTLASDHLSAVQLFFGWLSVLYQRTADVPASNTEALGDGTIRMWGTFSDGGQYEWFVAPDGSSRGSVSWGDGTQFTQVADAAVWNGEGTIGQTHVVNTYPGGAQIDMRITDDFSGEAYHGVWAGTARLATGAAMDFTLDRRELDRDELRLELPDGAVATFRVRLTALDYRPYWPRYAEGATGTFTAPGRGVTQVQVGAQVAGDGDGVWNQWQFAAANGTEGLFALEADTSGTGQLERSGEVVGALRWTREGLGTLDLLGAGIEEVTPSAASQAFRLDRWVRNIALLGPTPVY
jgi:hypothetical protein